MRKAYISKGGRIFFFNEQEYKEQILRQGYDSFSLVETIPVMPKKEEEDPNGIYIYYPCWDGFLMHDGYGYIDYQYRTYGKAEGLFLETELKETHKAALVHHNPLRIYDVQKNFKKPIIAYTMWETDEFPQKYFDAINNAICVIVPSEFVKKTLINQGYEKPIFVCNQGADSNHYQWVDRNKGETFNFLHTATGNARKGWEYVIQAFEQEFAQDEDVFLTMKGLVKQKDNPQFAPFMNIPKVKWIDENYSREQSVNMYSEHHCLVFPTKGEGWGLVPHEAIMTGLPVITTRGHGQDDYWTSGMIPVKTKKDVAKYVPVPPVPELQNIHLDTWKNSGRWFETDVADLRKQMRKVYNNWEIYKQQAKEGSVYLTKNFSQQNMVNNLKEILIEIYDTLI